MEDELNKYQNKNEVPFKVPENYFENNKIKLLEITKSEPTKETKVFTLRNKIYTWTISTAAAVFIGVYLFVPNKEIAPTADSLSEIQTDHIEEYIFNEYLYNGEEAVLLSEVELEDLN